MVVACPVGSLEPMVPVPVRDDLSALEGYHSPQVSVSVRLNTNESPAAPPAGWRDALASELSRLDWHRYPDRGADELRQAIADQHGVDPAQVFAANGSNEVLQVLLLAYAGPGRTVATFEPTYQMHAQIARVTGARVIEGERAANFTLDLAEVDRVLAEHAPHVTFLCSPNNPTGLVEPRDRVIDLLMVGDGSRL
jgi:histidinol-phosphate aminotransferase